MSNRLYDELKQAKEFANHRIVVDNIRTCIDSKSTMINGSHFVHLNRINDNLGQYLHQMKENAILMENINNILRTHGEVKSFVSQYRFSIRHRYLTLATRRIRAINVDNLRFGHRICQVKGLLHTKASETEEQMEERLNRRRAEFVMPTKLLNKYEKLSIPNDTDLTRKLLRPKLFMDFEVENLRPLGRVIIQLFTEASPHVVLELMRFCETRDPRDLKFPRVFPRLWMQCELPIDLNSPLCKPLEYDMRALDHTACPCILSYRRRYNKGFKNDKLYFTISFKKMSVMNGMYVAFGRIYTGIKIIQCIQDYGTKNGKLSKGIIISNCGIFR